MNLIEALKVIQETCKKYDDCGICPLRASGDFDCQLDVEAPSKWVFETETVPQRVFK